MYTESLERQADRTNMNNGSNSNNNNKKAQLSLTNPRDAKACQNCSIRHAYNVVVDNTGLSSCV